MKKKIFFTLGLIAAICIAVGLYLQFFYLEEGEERKIYIAEDFPNALQYMTANVLEDSLADLNKQYQKLEEGDEHVYIRWINIGILKKRLHDYVGVEEAWQHAITYNPDQYLAFGNLADFYLYDLGDHVKAEEYYIKVLEMRPDYFAYYFGLAQLYRYNMPEKEHLIEELMLGGAEYNPMEGAAYYSYLAEYFFGRQETWDKSRLYRQKALELDPEIEDQLPDYEL